MNKTIIKYEKVCQEVALEIIKTYFSEWEGVEYGHDWWWIGDTIGGVMGIGDYFFHFDALVEALRYGATEKQFFDYYDYCLDLASEGKPIDINFKNYILHDETSKESFQNAMEKIRKIK